MRPQDQVTGTGGSCKALSCQLYYYSCILKQSHFKNKKQKTKKSINLQLTSCYTMNMGSCGGLEIKGCAPYKCVINLVTTFYKIKKAMI